LFCVLGVVLQTILDVYIYIYIYHKTRVPFGIKGRS
jgi:hypothetical protein